MASLITDTTVDCREISNISKALKTITSLKAFLQ